MRFYNESISANDKPTIVIVNAINASATIVFSPRLFVCVAVC